MTRAFSVLMLCLTLLAMSGAALAQHHGGGGGDERGHYVVLINEGHRAHTVQLYDRDPHGNDGSDHAFNVAPGQRFQTNRRWEGDSWIHVDGQRRGRLADAAVLEEHHGHRMFVYRFRGGH